MAKIGENVKINLLKIAVTGEISSGKSTVCKYFKENGAYVVDADKIVHMLLSLKTSVGKQVVKYLGKDIIEKEEISRKLVADIVFKDLEKLKKIEKLIHPYVFKEIESIYNVVNAKGKYLFFVAEIPLLYETGNENFYDYVVVVKSGQKKRSEKTNSLREKRLMDITEKIEKADFVIINDSSFTALKRKVTKISNILAKIIKENTSAWTKKI